MDSRKRSGSFYWKIGEWVAFVGKWIGVCCFCRKMPGSGFFLEKWVRVGRYCRNKGKSVSFLSNNGWEWVVFLEKWVRVGHFSWKMSGSGPILSTKWWEWAVFIENWWEWGFFIEKWVGVGCFWKFSGSGWEWLGAQFGKARISWHLHNL